MNGYRKRTVRKKDYYVKHPLNLLLLLAKIFYYGVLLFLLAFGPFIVWEWLDMARQIGPEYKTFFIISGYFISAMFLLYNYSEFIIESKPYNKWFHFRKSTREEEDNCGDFYDWPSK